MQRMPELRRMHRLPITATSLLLLTFTLFVVSSTASIPAKASAAGGPGASTTAAANVQPVFGNELHKQQHSPSIDDLGNKNGQELAIKQHQEQQEGQQQGQQQRQQGRLRQQRQQQAPKAPPAFSFRGDASPPAPMSNEKPWPETPAGDANEVDVQQKGKSIHPRIDISEVSDMAETNPYRRVMLMAWHEMTTSKDTSDPLGLFALAGVHGQSWSYNNQRPRMSSGGFCLHRSEDFAGWHRPYILQFEKGLIKAAETAVSRLTNSTMRRKYQRVAKTIRVPYLDWTSGHIPSILTMSSVEVLDSSGQPALISNPFLNYFYPMYVGGGRGSRVTRSESWQSSLTRSADKLSADMTRFIQSRSWQCTFQPGGFSGGFMAFNRGGRGCPSSLEGAHNNVHNIIGGSSGEMATVGYAGFDPLFWLHHSQIDRMLWLFQNNGGGWRESSSYVPFSSTENLQDLHNIGSLGYTFRDALYQSNTLLAAGRRRRQLLVADPNALPSEVDIPDAGTEVGSPAAVAAVQRALAVMSRGHSGYSWQFQMKELDRGQLGETVHVHLFLAGQYSQEPFPAANRAGGSALDANKLRQRSDYCGSVSGFNDYMKMAPGAEGPVAEAIIIDSCLEAAGVNLDAAPADGSDRSQGPARPVISVKDFRLLALTAAGEDVTDRFDFGPASIGWALPVQQKFSSLSLNVQSGVGTAQGTTAGLLNDGQEVVGLAMGCFD